MGLQTWNQVITPYASVAGPTITVLGAATCLPAPKVITLPANYWVVGKKWIMEYQGIISCVITTPGTARFDVRMGAVVAFDTGALILNSVAKTNVPFWLRIILECRTVGSGTGCTLWGLANFQSEAVVGSPVNSVGGNGALLAPVGTMAAGTGFDSTVTQVVQSDFTQTVSTGSMTVQLFDIFEAN